MSEQTIKNLPLGESPKYTGKSYEKDSNYTPYLPSLDLIEAVNLAIDLKRPLLLEGAPGCGKTRLAEAIAYEFSQEYLSAGNWPLYTWNVKSTERARDGLYIFDGVARLRDAQLLAGGSNYLQEDEQKKLIEDLQDKEKTKYITYGAFGKVLKDDFTPGIRPILLIDEIDKADSDLPNDLLLETDKLCFEVKESGKSYSKEKSDYPPLIIITSNRERLLSEAFLRRCLYFYVDFPSQEELTKIIHRRLGDRLKYHQLVPATISRLEQMRRILSQQPVNKPPGTSEVIDLIEALQRYSTEADALAKLEQIADNKPLAGIVIKTQQDLLSYKDGLKAEAKQDG